jgi:tRNA pseudouridine38-40 synthase
MPRYFLELSFEGTYYHGWQIQDGAISVQQILNEALSKILPEPVNTLGCGRTDTGVHASQFYAHFDSPITCNDQLVYKLNSILPKDIAIYRLIRVEDQAHARFDATHRSYQYHIHFQKNPFLDRYSYFLQARNFDPERMIPAAEFLMEISDFASLCRENHDAKTTLCTMYESHWTQQNGQWIYTITANRFLRSMVRLIVGAMVAIGRGKLSMDDFKNQVLSAQRFKYLKPAPPNGLFLTSVRYPYL